MFQFSRCPSRSLCIQKRMTLYNQGRISPFGNLRINTLVQLPGAFRRCRVLLRQFVPRHSSHTLKSLLFAAYECSMHDSLSSILDSKCELRDGKDPHSPHHGHRYDASRAISTQFALRALCNFQRARTRATGTESSGEGG